MYFALFLKISTALILELKFTVFEQIFENFLPFRMLTKYENKWKFEKNGFKPKTFSTKNFSGRSSF